MKTAKELFDFTKSQNDKLKNEKLAFVEKVLDAAACKEQYSVSFNFLELKPFSGMVVEKLTNLGYKVTNSGTSLVVSWASLGEEENKNRPLVLSEDYEDDLPQEDEEDPWQSSGSGC